jgi:CDP-paratose 2-epimerase
MLEGITICEEITGKKMSYSYSETNRIGDHIWYISDLSKFKEHYPTWNWKYGLNETLQQIHDGITSRL